MSWEQAIVAVLIALISAVLGGLGAEKIKDRRERALAQTARVDSLGLSTAEVEKARLTDEAQKRKELEDASREIREFLRKQVAELNVAIDRIEVARADEREKWHQMLGDLTAKNLELELRHRRDMSRIQELEEDAQIIEDRLKAVRTQVVTLEGNVMIMTANLSRCEAENRRLKSRKQQQD